MDIPIPTPAQLESMGRSRVVARLEFDQTRAADHFSLVEVSVWNGRAHLARYDVDFVTHERTFDSSFSVPVSKIGELIAALEEIRAEAGGAK